MGAESGAGGMALWQRIAVSGLLLVSAAACAGPQPGALPGSGAPPPGAAGLRRITVAIRGDAKTLSSKLNSAGGAGGVPGVPEIEEMLNAGLAIKDDSGAFHLLLAEDLPTVENGLWIVLPGGQMETTWRIKPTVQWHDGAPFTSEDLLFTATVEQDAELPIFRNVAYRAIDSVEAPDQHTVTIKWKRPFIEAATMFTSSRALPMPRHLLERPYGEDKGTFLNVPYWNREFVGTGAYKLREFAVGSYLILEANDHYVLGRPRIDQIEVKFIPDPSTIAANILAGEVDLTLGGRLSLEWGVQVRNQWRAGRMEVGVPTSMVSAYPQFINANPPIMTEAPFRRALLHAVDRQQIIDSLVEGLAPFGHSIISANHAEWKDVEAWIVKYDYDSRKAIQMIEGLGYGKGVDGFFRDSAGQRLSVEMRTQATDDTQMKTMFSIADYWQRVGLGVDLAPFPQQLASDREYRATRPGFEVVRQPGGWENLQRFHGANTPLPENDFTGINRTRHRNPEFDALIDRFFSTIPRADRMQILGQLMHYMTDQVLILSMFWDPGPAMVSNRLRGVSSPGEVWDVHLWEVISSGSARERGRKGSFAAGGPPPVS